MLLNCVIRIITKSDFDDAHPAPLFDNEELLSLKNRYSQQVGLFLYSYTMDYSISRSKICSN